jgi:pre-mRNA-processing factor 6
MQACKLESDPKEKKSILRKALEFVPDSMRLWKAAIELEEDPEDAKIMLAAAVEYIPYSVELWLALARLESKDRAKQVLNKARKNCPLSSEIWIAAAKLEESNGSEKMVEIIIKRGVQTLLQAGAKMDREAWLKEAESCEETGNILTCQAIIRSTIGLGLEEEDFETTWAEDAEQVR